MLQVLDTGKPPVRTLAFERQKCAAGHKSSKEHLTVISCGNSFGNHELKLVATVRAKKPWSFKGAKVYFIPVHYYKQKGAWIDRGCFEFLLKMMAA
jgi:hypothetical protein